MSKTHPTDRAGKKTSSERNKPLSKSEARAIRAEKPRSGSLMWVAVLVGLLAVAGVVGGVLYVTSVSASAGTGQTQTVNHYVNTTIYQNVSVPIPGNTFCINVNGTGTGPTDLIFGNSSAIGNISNVELLIFGIDTSLLHSILASGQLSWVLGNLSIYVVVFFDSINPDGSFPANTNFTFPSNVSLMPAYMSFDVNWLNGTNARYAVNFVNGLTPEQLGSYLPYIVCENASTYTLQFGGFHFNPSIGSFAGEFDYSPVYLNGLYLDAPITFGEFLP
jgi:hypothetical protein